MSCDEYMITTDCESNKCKWDNGECVDVEEGSLVLAILLIVLAIILTILFIKFVIFGNNPPDHVTNDLIARGLSSMDWG
jgi:hypothetical protein